MRALWTLLLVGLAAPALAETEPSINPAAEAAPPAETLIRSAG
jgi:hypothetical protein